MIEDHLFFPGVVESLIVLIDSKDVIPSKYNTEV